MVEPFGLLVLALCLVEPCQAIEDSGCVGVSRSQLLLCDRQGTPVEQLGFLVIALKTAARCQIHQCLTRCVSNCLSLSHVLLMAPCKVGAECTHSNQCQDRHPEENMSRQPG